MSRSNSARGACCALGAAVSMACMGAAVRYCATDLSNTMLVFLRSAFGLLALLPWVLHRERNFLRTRHFGFHLTRSLTGLAAMYCFFYALARLRLADAMLLNFSSPLFVAPLAWLILREPLPPRVVFAIAVGFIGITLVLKPNGAFFNGPGSVGLLSGMLAALAMISVRRLAATEPSLRTVFYFSLISTLISALLLTSHWQTPPGKLLLLMAIAGIFASLGQILLTQAYALAPAARIGPFSYTTVIFAALIDWALWQQHPDALSVLGASLVCLSGHLVQTTPEPPRQSSLGQQRSPE